MAIIVTLSYYIITFSIEKSINAFKPKLDTSPQKSVNMRLESMPAIAYMQDECDSKNFDRKHNDIELDV